MAYGQSKTASSLIAIEFNRLMHDKGVSGFSVHPGGIITPLQRHLENEEMVALGWMNEDGSPSDLAKNFLNQPVKVLQQLCGAQLAQNLNNIGGICEDCGICEKKI